MVESICSILQVLNGCHIAMPLELMDQVCLIVKVTVNCQVHPVEMLVIFDICATLAGMKVYHPESQLQKIVKN